MDSPSALVINAYKCEELGALYHFQHFWDHLGLVHQQFLHDALKLEFFYVPSKQ